ncbi:MAG TPA: hypothetical protein VGV68_10840 [Terriglobia bacterium]|nr:hypothetical protein [Terriglobia bacterium]
MVIGRQVGFALLGAAALSTLAFIALGRSQGAAAKKEGEGQQSAPVFGQLYPGEKTELPIHGWRSIVIPVECDADGDVYILTAANLQVAQHLGGMPITRIKPGSSHLTEFDPASPADYAGYLHRSFYVDPHGAVYTLIEAYKRPLDYNKGPNIPDILVAKYKDDGTVDSVTKLEPPPGPHLFAYQFAVFPDGSFLLTGNLVSGTPGVSSNLMPTEPFTWIFNRSGAFEAPVKLADDVHPPDKNWTKEGRKGGEWVMDIQHSGMLGSIDGTVYLYRASDPVRLYAISSSGSVFREVTIKPPQPGMQPLEASLAGSSQILIQFRGTPSPNDTRPSPIVLTLANLETGAVAGNYKVPADAGTPACGGPGGKALFLGLSKQGNMEVNTFVPR